jgi:ubiquinone/menaquinone biosynthesis C-methylase UbiE
MADTQVVFDNAAAYERYMGQWSRAVGEKFLAWLDAPRDRKWLDVGCGTGAFSQLIVDKCAPRALAAIDPAPAQVEHARKVLPQADFRVADALALPLGDGEFDIVVSALVLHFLPDRAKAVAEMRRVARRGGIVAGYTWNRTPEETFAPYAPLVRGLKRIGAPVTLSPLVPEAAPEGLETTLKAEGLRDITIELIEATEGYRDFDEYWQVQTLTFHPISKSVEALSEVKRGELRELMREMLAPAQDGHIRYSARAIAFRARTP